MKCGLYKQQPQSTLNVKASSKINVGTLNEQSPPLSPDQSIREGDSQALSFAGGLPGEGQPMSRNNNDLTEKKFHSHNPFQDKTPNNNPSSYLRQSNKLSNMQPVHMKQLKRLKSAANQGRVIHNSERISVNNSLTTD